MKLLQLIFFMITIVGSSSAHSVTWLEYDSADSTDTATINDRGKIPRLLFLEVDEECHDTYKFGVVILENVTANGRHYGRPRRVLDKLMTWFARKDVCALVVAPKITATSWFFTPQLNMKIRWDTNDTLTDSIERIKLNNLINKVASLTSEGVFLMGGSTGAIMAHNVALNAINDGNTANLKGVVMVDGISAKQLCYYECSPNTPVDRICPETGLPIGIYKYLDQRIEIEPTGLIDGKLWTLPTLLLAAKDDCTIPFDLKEDFANKIWLKGQSTVVREQAGIGHRGDAWDKGTIHIKNGIRLVLPQLNLP